MYIKDYLLFYIFLMQHGLHAMTLLENYSKAAASQTKLKSIETSLPCLPTVLCHIIAGYAAEWKLQSRCMVNCDNTCIRKLVSTAHKFNTQITVYTADDEWVYDLQTQKAYLVFLGKGIPKRTTHTYKDKLAMASDDGTVRIFSPPGSTLLKKFNIQEDPSCIWPKITKLSWNHDAHLLVLTSKLSSNLQIWNCQDKPVKIREIRLLSAMLNNFVCSPRDNTIVIKTEPQPGSTGSLSCFDLLSGTQRWSTPINDYHSDLCFSPDGALVVSGSDGEWTEHGRLITISVYDATDGACIASFPGNECTGAFTFLTNNTLVIAQNSARKTPKPLGVYALE